MHANSITQTRLKELLHFSPDTGLFTWLKRKPSDFKVAKQSESWNIRFSGKKAGSPHCQGYLSIAVFHRKLLAHRLAWLYIYGELPEDQIDHIDHCKTNNKISNLRLASNAMNGKNMSFSKANTSGFTGVVWHKAAQKWSAQICHEGKRKYLGLFTNKQDAIAARTAAELKYNFHPNHGSR